jgi:hypothetical protein
MTLIATVPVWCDIGLLTDCRIVRPDANLCQRSTSRRSCGYRPHRSLVSEADEDRKTTAGTAPGSMNEGM